VLSLNVDVGHTGRRVRNHSVVESLLAHNAIVSLLKDVRASDLDRLLKVAIDFLIVRSDRVLVPEAYLRARVVFLLNSRRARRHGHVPRLAALAHAIVVIVGVASDDAVMGDIHVSFVLDRVSVADIHRVKAFSSSVVLDIIAGLLTVSVLRSCLLG